MKTIELDITQKRFKKEIDQFFYKNKIARGDRLKIWTDENISELTLFGIFLIIAGTLVYWLHNSQRGNQSNKWLDKIYKKDTSVKDIEQLIEEECGVEIDIELKPRASFDPFEDSFGMWNNYHTSLEEIRTSAWERTN